MEPRTLRRLIANVSLAVGLGAGAVVLWTDRASGPEGAVTLVQWITAGGSVLALLTSTTLFLGGWLRMRNEEWYRGTRDRWSASSGPPPADPGST